MGGEQGGSAVLDRPVRLCGHRVRSLLLHPLQRRQMKTLVYGFRESGVAAARALVERGEEVIVADSGDSESLRKLALEIGVEGRLGGIGREILGESFDRIVVSPGIRPRDAVLGNSWRALTSCLREVQEAGLLVLELSSFQLHYLPEPGFEVAALLNVRPDHLNWHA